MLVVAGEDDGPETHDVVVAIGSVATGGVPDGHPDGDLVVGVEAQVAPLVASKAADLSALPGRPTDVQQPWELTGGPIWESRNVLLDWQPPSESMPRLVHPHLLPLPYVPNLSQPKPPGIFRLPEVRFWLMQVLRSVTGHCVRPLYVEF